MPINKDRAKEVFDFVTLNGKDKALEYFSVSLDSLNRYLRRAKEFGVNIIYENKAPRLPKILLLDIETAPMQVFSWTLFKPRLSHVNIIQDWFVISWSAKWLFEAEIMGDVLTKEEALASDDCRVIKSIWKLMDEADIIIGHNGDRFDIRKLNTRYILHKLAPPRPYQTIDTLTISRKYFLFSSNRLDYLGELIRNKGKIETNFGLWKNCINGIESSLIEMLTYNREDVNLLEEVYIMLRPWIKSHPNMAIYSEATDYCCPNCGSFDLTMNGHYTTMAGQFNSFRCNNCGAPSRMGSNLLSHNDRKKLLRSNAR